MTPERIRSVEVLNYSYRERTSRTQLNLTQYCFRQSIIECITLLNNFRGLRRSNSCVVMLQDKTKPFIFKHPPLILEVGDAGFVSDDTRPLPIAD